jgi:hypothetical protein
MCRMGARTGSRLIELSEVLWDVVPCLSTVLLIIAIATSVVGVAATDMVAESSAKDDPSFPPRSAVQAFTVC